MKKMVVVLVMILFTTLLAEEIIKSDSLEIISGFYATGINTPGFFLSKHIPPKVKPEEKTNMLFIFFTTSCIPCKKEIPFLQKYAQKYAIEKCYLINIGDKKDIVEKYLETYQYKIKVLHDPYGTISKKLAVESTPSMFIVSGDGELLYRHDGISYEDTTEIIDVMKNYFPRVDE